ncbi:MAG: pilin [Patescibacteria group bacterium]
MRKSKILVFSLLTITLLFIAFEPALAECQPGELCNPLQTDDVRVVVGRVIQAIIGLSGVLAFAMFIWGGFMWLISAGNPERVKQGKDTLIWALIGLVVIFTAYTLVTQLIEALATGVVS